VRSVMETCARIDRSSARLYERSRRRHGPSVQVKATVKLVRGGVESPEVSSSSVGGVPRASIPRWYAEERASISIKGLQRTRTNRAVHALVMQHEDLTLPFQQTSTLGA
jgi:hypothetical protein